MRELNLKFGQVPFWSICRFVEISKIEIIVFSFICAKRFRRLETADCSRSEIVEFTKLDKSQVSVAIKKLKSINWLTEKSKTKWFIPEIEPAKVDKSLTNKKSKKVVESPTEVDESSMKVDDSSTRIYKEYSSDVTDKQTTKNIADKSARRVRQISKLRPPEYKHYRESLFDLHNSRLNGAVHAAAAQNLAIGWLFDNSFSLEDCLIFYAEQVKELKPNGWRSSVSWLTVKQQIADWVSQGRPTMEKKNGTRIQQHKRTNTEIFQESADFYADWETGENLG